MKILYLCTWDFIHEQSDGVCKKIRAQIKVFESYGLQVDFIYIKENKIIYKENGVERELAYVGNIKKTPAYIKMYRYLKDKRYDWVYNRYGLMDTFYYRVLKRLRRNGARILVELPTYPYVGEKPEGLLYQIMYWWDDMYTPRLHKIIDRLLTYTQDTEIWSMPTIRIMNGIDLSQVTPAVRTERCDDTIHLLAVALMQPYQGYERILYGLKRYYEHGGKRNIIFHMVGDGSEKAMYERIVEQNSLQEHVLFYGRKTGRELDEIYNLCDIGMCSFGYYKVHASLSSQLKIRDYLAKGLPIVAGVDTDVFQIMEKNYYLQLPNDSSSIDVDMVVDFYDRIYGTNERQTVADNIRKMSEKYISMEAVMKPVCDYIRRNNTSIN